jgi:hypothetical protein
MRKQTQDGDREKCVDASTTGYSLELTWLQLEILGFLANNYHYSDQIKKEAAYMQETRRNICRDESSWKN